MEQKQDCDCGYDHVHVAEATADGTKMPFSQAMTEMLRKLSEYGVEMGDKAGGMRRSAFNGDSNADLATNRLRQKS